jgi:heme/copper-type cytochrome/quinol oxidase subunit 4
LRSFTAEDLEDRIRLREAKKSVVNKYAAVVVLSFVLAGLTYLVPSRLSAENKVVIAASVQMAAVQLVNVWLYLSNLKNFKKEFSQAFVYISVGMLPLGVFFAQIGLVQILGIADAPPFQYASMRCSSRLKAGLRRY